ncbi:GlmU family protein [Aureibacter tunicatorum]|uniref:UDP-N-acetylglucosamine diphosphorylase/glucosamine-1-phosphate N-acetyltransferase n=1 Tax=Aureibacter tunicatorum TaxID=866807 RepID=A0AAE4BRB3_9BACT|nr:GlmU family protein [Aureibacter tunicatorum]MDR6237072.1 UDP-N-acetylglucosamine diphosphorylase/glucosamine-1-phosphate N-acetyltransferase [Aureibacter tunicatorum]BDD06064.1 glucose-1-phosphate thymidylyltransferase [Aureibacter tunicatorum]
MNVIIYENKECRKNLLPFTYTRAIAQIRVGIFTLLEKWEKHLKASINEFDFDIENTEKIKTETLYINASCLPTSTLAQSVNSLYTGEKLTDNNDELIAFKTSDETSIDKLAKRILDEEPKFLKKSWDIFAHNGEQIRNDFPLAIDGKQSEPIEDPYTIVYNPRQVFIEKGVKIRAAILNADNGPIYIGKNAEIQENSVIQGPFGLCEGAVINMGGKMRRNTTIGPYSKVGGEISNSVILGYSNKGHEGFLGNSVIGEWCNLGADTNTSNLKNNYSEVKVWDYNTEKLSGTGLQFCGLLMGDHSKAGINTMFNTGTVVGIAANIYGGGFPPKFIPSFSWGGADGFTTHAFDKMLDTAEKVMARRLRKLEKEDIENLKNIFEKTRKFRLWEQKESINV